MVLSPSKNLSRQTFRVCQRLLSGVDYNLKCFVWGDAPMREDLQAFKRCVRGGGNIMISHPQALLDRIRQAKGRCGACLLWKNGVAAMNRGPATPSVGSRGRGRISQEFQA